MKQLNLTLADNRKPLYLRLADALRQQIKTAIVAPGDAMPSARILAEQLQTNRHTVMAAYRELIAEGWVASRQRQGYRVVSELPTAAYQSSQIAAKTPPQPFPWRLAVPELQLHARPAADYEINFSGGCPDIGLFPFKEFKSYLAQACDRPRLDTLNYGDNAGLPLFIEQLDIYLRRARAISGRQIVVVNGSQEALYILSRLLLQPGDKVAVEQLGYRPAWQSFSATGAELLPVVQDHQGMDPTHLEQLASQQKIALIYLTPLHQYPTTVTLPVARRLQIYRIAARHRIPIIEDDYDHEFHFRCQPLAPMAADDPEGLVIYLSTFSKIMFPGIRVGFIAADAPLADAIVRYRSLMNHKSNVLIQDAIGRWMADGAFARYLRKLTRTYEQRRDQMIAGLNDIRARGHALDFAQPDGGMALWVDIGRGAGQLATDASAHSVFLQDESRFHLVPAHNRDRFIRLGYAGMAETPMQQGLDRLAALLAKRR